MSSQELTGHLPRKTTFSLWYHALTSFREMQLYFNGVSNGDDVDTVRSPCNVREEREGICLEKEIRTQNNLKDEVSSSSYGIMPWDWRDVEKLKKPNVFSCLSHPNSSDTRKVFFLCKICIKSLDSRVMTSLCERRQERRNRMILVFIICISWSIIF